MTGLKEGGIKCLQIVTIDCQNSLSFHLIISNLSRLYFKSDSRSYFKELLLATMLLRRGRPFVSQACLGCHVWQRCSHSERSREWQVSKLGSHQMGAVTALNAKQAAVTLGENQIGRPRTQPEGSCSARALCIAEEKKNQKQGKGREYFMSIFFFLSCIACPI